jgi:hypothetical protein
MDPVRIAVSTIMTLGGAYALWLVSYRWHAILADDPSLQRLSNTFGPRMARIIAALFSIGFLLLGLALVIEELFL